MQKINHVFQDTKGWNWLRVKWYRLLRRRVFIGNTSSAIQEAIDALSPDGGEICLHGKGPFLIDGDLCGIPGKDRATVIKWVS